MVRTLVADDDGITFTLVCKWLASAGHEAVEARKGKQALAAALRSPAAQVVMFDYRMPHLTGLKVGRRIRVPFLTTSAEDVARAECMRLSGLAYLRMPTDPDTLLGDVNDALALFVEENGAELGGRWTQYLGANRQAPRDSGIVGQRTGLDRVRESLACQPNRRADRRCA